VNVMLFPDEAIAILRQAVFDPAAVPFYEVMSDSLWWPDELVRDTSEICRRHNSWTFRFLMGFRGTVISGKPDIRLRTTWQQVAETCPAWPGLREERNSPALANELRRERRRQCLEFRRFEREFTE
jgi:hypothetical protein